MLPSPSFPSAPPGRSVDASLLCAVALFATLLAGGCASPSPSTASDLWADAAGGVSDADLAALSRDLWEQTLAWNPVMAGRLGDARYLGRLPDRSAAARQQRADDLKALDERAAALESRTLEAQDRVTLAMARRSILDARGMLTADLDRWAVNPLRGPHNMLLGLAGDQPAETAAERAALIRRWSGMGAFLDQSTADLRRGVRARLFASHHAVSTTIEQLDRLLEQDVEEWPLARPARAPDLVSAERAAFYGAIEQHLRDGLRPALGRHRAVLVNEILPHARSDDAPGLASLQDGEAVYATLMDVHLSLPWTPDELHAFGLAEVERIRSEMSALGAALFATSDVAEIQQRLRDDPDLHFDSRSAVEATATASLARATEAMDEWFGRLPQADCIIVPIPDHEAPETTIAYYRGPAADGSMPGRYFVNSWAPETRPRYEAEVLAYHEAIPGHHLQIAIAQELPGIPAFRRHGGSTAFVEGWGLYTERLSGEMGLYSGDLDRMGVLSFDAWRACRLVVDTGLHAMGWSRQQAIDYVFENTLLAHNNVVNEVDRYITTPGQALAYKVGQREILDLRTRARTALGDRFDIKAFHDVVLGSGAVTLDILRRNVAEWVQGQGSAFD